MGQAHPGAQVLLVAPDTSDLSRIAEGNVELVQDEIAEHATLSKLGDEAQLEVKRVLRGVSAEQFRLAFERASHDQVVRGLGNAMERRYPGSKLAGEPEIHDDPVQNVFSIATTYKVPKFASEKNGNWAVYFKPDNLLDVVTSSPSAERKTALRIPRFPFHGKYSFEVAFPPEVSFTGDPNAQTVANDYFNMTISDYFRGNIARKSVELTTLRADVEAEKYPAYSDQLVAANKAVGGVIFVAKSIIKQDDAEARLSLADRLRKTLEDSIKKVDETIAAGKITGSDLAEAYCLRGTNLALLGKFDEALHDANSALRIAPGAGNSLSCRGEIDFQAGQFDGSIADHSKAIALGATNAIEFRGRGVSRFYAGRLEEAAADFAKASELADRETRIYCDIWLATTLGLLGKKVPEDVIKRAASDVQGEWPRPGLAMMTGAITPEDMLQSLQKKSGDDRDMALAEGYFYIGQHYLAAGDRKTAEAYFRKTRDVGVIIYTEHIAAGFALKQLQGEGTANSAAKPAIAN
jgi:lipoprotein NlpI